MYIIGSLVGSHYNIYKTLRMLSIIVFHCGGIAPYFNVAVLY